MRMKERVVIVTGAARGLGRGFAERLAAEGAAVVCGDLRPCDETVAAIRGAGGRAVALRLDVTDMASCLASAETAVAEFGRLDGLVNNAALYADIKGARFDQIEEKQWDAVMNVNVKGIWQMCKAAVPQMRKAGGGSISSTSRRWPPCTAWLMPSTTACPRRRSSASRAAWRANWGATGSASIQWRRRWC